MVYSRPWLFRAQTWSLAAFYWLVVAALAIWVWQRRRDAHRQEAEAMQTNRTPGKSYAVWITLGMLGPAWILGTFVFALFFTNWTLSSKHIPEVEARSIIFERKDARFTIDQYRDESKSLVITLPENHRVSLWTPLNDSLFLHEQIGWLTYRMRGWIKPSSLCPNPATAPSQS